MSRHHAMKITGHCPDKADAILAAATSLGGFSDWSDQDGTLPDASLRVDHALRRASAPGVRRQHVRSVSLRLGCRLDRCRPLRRLPAVILSADHKPTTSTSTQGTHSIIWAPWLA